MPCNGELTKPDFKRAEFAIVAGGSLGGTMAPKKSMLQLLVKSKIAAYKPRHFAIDFDDKKLHYYKTAKGWDIAKSKPLNSIDLLDVAEIGKSVGIDGGDDTHFYFELQTAARRYVLGASSDELRAKWMDALQSLTVEPEIVDDAEQVASVAAATAEREESAAAELDEIEAIEKALPPTSEVEARLHAEASVLIASFKESDALDAWWREPKGKLYKPDFKKSAYMRVEKASALHTALHTKVLWDTGSADFKERHFRLRVATPAPLFNAAAEGGAGEGDGAAASATFRPVLDYYGDEHTSKRSGTIELSRVVAISASTQEGRPENAIELTTLTQTYVLLAPNHEMAARWIAALTLLTDAPFKRSDQMWMILDEWSALEANALADFNAASGAAFNVPSAAAAAAAAVAAAAPSEGDGEGADEGFAGSSSASAAEGGEGDEETAVGVPTLSEYELQFKKTEVTNDSDLAEATVRTLGITLVLGTGSCDGRLVIGELANDGDASKSGVVTVGDVLRSINGAPVHTASRLDEVHALLAKKFESGTLQLSLSRVVDATIHAMPTVRLSGHLRRAMEIHEEIPRVRQVRGRV